MKHLARLLTVCLLLALCLAVTVGCTTPDGGSNDIVDTTAADTTAEATETLPATKVLTLDGTYHICIPEDADEITRKTADMMAATLKEKAGLELSVGSVADHSSDRDIILAPNTLEGERAYEVSCTGSILRIAASDATTLYYATEAILDAWLTEDFGLSEAGAVTLAEDRVAELNGLTTRLDNSITVLTQNVRYADDPNRNTVQIRSQRFMELLEEYQPDLIGCQEYTGNWNVWLEKHTKKAGGTGALDGYEMIGCSREGRDKNDGERNPVFYRTDRFELLDSDTTWLCDTPTEAGAVEGSLCKRICTWALLKDKQTGETILFANTHLDHSTDEVRGKQMDILMDYLADRIGEYPFYLTGDFNCTSDSVPYSTAVSKLSDAHRTAWVDYSTETRTYHAYEERGGGEIDFIFHNEKTAPVSYEIISKGYGGYVSDHFGVVAEFVNE